MPYFPKVKFDSQSTGSVVFLENVTLKVVAPWFNHSRFLENRKSYHDGGIKIPNLTGSKQLSWKIRGSFCQLTVVWLNNFVRLPIPRNEEHELWNKICWLMWIETGSSCRFFMCWVKQRTFGWNINCRYLMSDVCIYRYICIIHFFYYHYRLYLYYISLNVSDNEWSYP